MSHDTATAVVSGAPPADSGDESRDPVQAPVDPVAHDRDRTTRLAHLGHAIDHAGHLLPAQGPITVFIHHNTLHAFEDLPFDEATQKGARIFGCQPYLAEDRYRQELARGRIKQTDLEATLREELGSEADAPVLTFGTRLSLRLAMLEYPLWQAPAAELRWFVAETDALARYRQDAPAALRERFIRETRHWIMRDVRTTSGNGHANGNGAQPHVERRIHDALAELLNRFGQESIERWSDATWEAFGLQSLWRVCRDGVHGIKPFVLPSPGRHRHRDLLLEATGEDSDRPVHDLLIRFTSTFLDQGFADWELPDRQDGYFAAFSRLYRQPFGPPDAWLRGLAAELERISAAGLSPLESVLESLEMLGVPESEWETFLVPTLLALRGWGGMIRQVELRSDRVVRPIPGGSVIEFLAVRLILERLSLAYIARGALGFTGPLSELRAAAAAAAPKHESSSLEQRAFLMFQLAQNLGWLPSELYHLTKADWTTLLHEVEPFTSLDRRKIFHRAFERRYRVQALDAVSLHSRRSREREVAPRCQVVTCLDEREESFRRHLEEVAPDIETFGAAGFFNVAMYFRGVADANFTPLCPIVIRPQHWVQEECVYSLEESNRLRKQARKALGKASHQFHMGSRTFTVGALLAAGLGVLASVPLVARVLFPRLTSRIRESASRWVQPPPVSRLELERSTPEAAPEEGSIGYSLAEMANIGERFLRDIGLTTSFARLVAVLGHGSLSMNNPHKSAYDCGACGGNAGGPNARALCQILNDPRVRRTLDERGLHVPDETWFVGGFHNTCDDSVTWSDLNLVPKNHVREFETLRKNIENACDRNAHERCRRFISAPLTMSFPAARRHVENRSADLAQTRPECGHATNAICFVGRRSRTRGLFMDRRTFLTSYDPTLDTLETMVLTRLLQAAVPVCGGINLEYYFSYVDNPGWGCGTKLPHNVTSLLGIMDGPVSDLRPGLPWQMVEIHEPVRLLFIVETSPEKMLAVMDQNPGIGQMIKNGWVQMSLLDPESSAIHVYRNNRFERYEPESTELPKVKASTDWYRGWRDHLGFAVVEMPEGTARRGTT